MREKIKKFITKSKVTIVKTWICIQCPLGVFDGNAKENLEHFLGHHDTKITFTCEICKASVKPKKKPFTGFKSHLLDAHFIDVKCKLCEKIMSNRSLKSHLETVHGKNNVNCEFCDKKNPIFFFAMITQNSIT